MKFEKYNPADEKGACVIRTFSKLFNKNFFDMKNELVRFIEDNNFNSYNDIEAFETFLLNKGYKKLDMNEEIIRKLNLEYRKCALLCHKDDFYHMVSIVDGIVFDKDDRSLDMNAIALYYLD